MANHGKEGGEFLDPLGKRRLFELLRDRFGITEVDSMPANLNLSELQQAGLLRDITLGFKGDTAMAIKRTGRLMTESKKLSQGASDRGLSDAIDILVSNSEPLLSAEEELALGKKLDLARQAKVKLDRGAENEDKSYLLRIAEEGERASNLFYLANIRLVASIARRYMDRGMEFPDLVNEGIFGLERAISKFDYREGYKFSTYATWWIRQKIDRALKEKSEDIRLPIHMQDKITLLGKISRRLEQQGIQPTLQRLSEESGLSLKKVKSLKSARKNFVDLNRPAGEDGDSDIEDFIADPNAVDPEIEAIDKIEKSEIADELRDILRRKLTDRELKVLEMRFLERDEKVTLEEIATILGRSRERIRQIEKEAFEKIKDPLRNLWKRIDGSKDSTVSLTGRSPESIFFGSREKGYLSPLEEYIFKLPNFEARVAYRKIFLKLSYDQISKETGFELSQVYSLFQAARISLWESFPKIIAQSNGQLSRDLLYFPEIDPRLMIGMYYQNNEAVCDINNCVFESFFGIDSGNLNTTYNIKESGRINGRNAANATRDLVKTIHRLEGFSGGIDS